MFIIHILYKSVWMVDLKERKKSHFQTIEIKYTVYTVVKSIFNVLAGVIVIYRYWAEVFSQ